MPVHDWTKVDLGIFHHFHASWLVEIKRSFNDGLLPSDFYALSERLDSDGSSPSRRISSSEVHSSGLTTPKVLPVAETDMAAYLWKPRRLVIHHNRDDRIAAIIEIVPPGHKASLQRLTSLTTQIVDQLAHGIHFLVVDLFPPGKRDPGGIHGEIWQEAAGKEYELPSDKSLTLASYDAGNLVRAFVLHLNVGEDLPDMPLFLEPNQAVEVPLETTYNAAFALVPQRWRKVLDAPA